MAKSSSMLYDIKKIPTFHEPFFLSLCFLDINLNEKSMEANENAKNVMMEEQQVMHPYFPEYTPMGSIEKTTGTVTEYDLMFRNNLINCVLVW